MIPTRSTALRCAELVSQAYALDAPRPMVAPIDGGIALAFAGSRCAGDWCIDGEAWHVSPAWAHGARIHKGFAGLADHCIDAAWSAIPPVILGNRIVITGHSLGAALALIIAYRFRDLMRFKPGLSDAFRSMSIEVVAFGCPRVGDRHFHAAYRARAIPTLRITCAHDPVAHAPGWWGWRHVGDSLHLDEDGTPLPDPTGLRETLRYWSRWPIGHLDHSMLGYHLALMAHEHRGFAWPEERVDRPLGCGEREDLAALVRFKTSVGYPSTILALVDRLAAAEAVVEAARAIERMPGLPLAVLTAARDATRAYDRAIASQQQEGT